MSAPGYGGISRVAPSAAGAECPTGNLDQLQKYLLSMMPVSFQRRSTSTSLSFWASCNTAPPAESHHHPPGGHTNPKAEFHRNCAPGNRDVSIRCLGEDLYDFPALTLKTYRKRSVYPSVGRKTLYFPGRQDPDRAFEHPSNLQGYRRILWGWYCCSQRGRTRRLKCYRVAWSRKSTIISPF